MVTINKNYLTSNNLVAFDVSDEDYLKLLNFNNYLKTYSNKSQQYLSNQTWKEWTKDYFIGFSDKKIYINNGFIFPGGKIIIEKNLKNNPLKEFFLLLKNFKKNHSLTKINDQKKLEEIFKKIYKKKEINYLNPKFNHIYEKLKNYYPLQYYLALEMLVLINETNNIEKVNFKNILEIGPGLCVFAIILFLNYSCSLFLVDIPQTLNVAYLNLKIFLNDIEIFFPNEIDFNGKFQANKIYLVTLEELERKLPKNYFNISINTSSFQEIDLKIVNDYINVCADLLVKDGEFYFNNQSISKHLKYSVDEYDISKFNLVEKKQALFASKVSQLINCGGHTYLKLKK